MMETIVEQSTTHSTSRHDWGVFFFFVALAFAFIPAVAGIRILAYLLAGKTVTKAIDEWNLSAVDDNDAPVKNFSHSEKLNIIMLTSAVSLGFLIAFIVSIVT